MLYLLSDNVFMHTPLIFQLNCQAVNGTHFFDDPTQYTVLKYGKRLQSDTFSSKRHTALIVVVVVVIVVVLAW